VERPADMFDRDFEWSALSRFATDAQPGATMGVVSGRRRQGKTYLLDAICQQAGGFYFGATQATEAESLRLFGEALTDHTRPPTPFHFADWHEAVDALLALGADRPVPVVIDEFPYLAQATPALPSIIQQAFGPRRANRVGSRTRLLLCGSAMSFMGGLLSGNAPLRGRAGLELVVPPLDYRLAAQFWDIDDPRSPCRSTPWSAARPHTGASSSATTRRPARTTSTPGCLRTVLNPESPLFREARYLLAEESQLRDQALYHSVLAAVAAGNGTRGGIAGYLGRKAPMSVIR